MFLRTAVIGLALLCTGAGTYDPEVDYFTITTPNFLVMYPAGYDHIALRSAKIAEDTLPFLVDRYGWRPDGRTSIVINDQTDFANGSATIIPSKVITIYVTAPTEVSGLEDYDDWLATVITHEMTHIIHLDMVYGLPWVGRLIFGKYVAMNSYTPGWVTEGFAVYEETVSSGAGRGRSSYVEMVLRMAALEDRFPGIDQAYRGYPNWPFSNIAYFIGGRFQLWLAEHYGEEALVHYHRAYASNPIPYFTWLPAQLAFDASLESLWSKFAEETLADAQLAVELVKSSSMAVTTPKRLTNYGGDLLGPRITPDGKSIIFSVSSPVDGARMRRIAIDGSNDEVLVNDTFSKEISFTPDGRAFYFQQTEINQRFYAHNSILRYELETENFSQVEIDPAETAGFVAPSGSMRARDPDVSPDGKRLVFVQTPYGSNRLVLAWLESDGTTVHPREIVPAEPDVQLSNPRFSPSGKLISVSRFVKGRRDLVLYDLDGKLVQEITRDRAQDIDGTWSPDGRWLVFSSDRTGIYNLFGYDTSNGELRQLTNLISGAYQPCISPDGTTIIYRGYSAEGFDVYQVPFSPETGMVVPDEKAPWTSGVDMAERRWPPRHRLAPDLPPPAPFTGTPVPSTLPENWEVDDYSSLDTILPFHDNWNLFPGLTANESEIYGSLTHFGSDAMGTQSYTVSVTYGSRTEFLGGGVAYVNDQFEPTFGFIALASARTFSGVNIVEQSLDFPCAFGEQPLDQEGRRYCYGADEGDYNERRLLGQFSLGLPFLQRHGFSLSYIFEHREALDELPAETLFSLLPRSGNFARVQLGYRYSNVRAFPHSISLERGESFNIALAALSRGLGSDYEEMVLTSEGRLYLSMPWTASFLRNHVLAIRLAIGASGGPDLAELFQMGGTVGNSALTTTTENFYGLRGFGSGVLRGTGLVNGSLEYRAPIFRVDRGPGTLPATLDVIHFALFADFGRVFDQVTLESIEHGFLEEIALGAGAELRADVNLFYGLPLTLILGYAYPVRLPDTAPNSGSPGVYFQLGASY
jgi:hypothetical protein